MYTRRAGATRLGTAAALMCASCPGRGHCGAVEQASDNHASKWRRQRERELETRGGRSRSEPTAPTEAPHAVGTECWLRIGAPHHRARHSDMNATGVKHPRCRRGSVEDVDESIWPIFDAGTSHGRTVYQITRMG